MSEIKNGLNVMPASMEPTETASLALTGDGISMYEKLQSFVKERLIQDLHYGQIKDSRTGKILVDKPVLFKGGAQILAKEAQLMADYEVMSDTEDFEQPFFAYSFKCTVTRPDGFRATGVGACNSKEKRYRSERQDQYALQNNVMKMAKKRAHVDAVIEAWGASSIFTQDMEDFRNIQDEETRMRKKSFGLATGKPDDPDPYKRGLGWATDFVKQYFRANCPYPDEDTGELTFKTVASRKEYKLENWEAMVAHLQEIMNNPQAMREIHNGMPPESSNAGNPPENKDELAKQARDLADQLGIKNGTLTKECHEQFGVSSLDAMTAEQWSQAVAMLKGRLEAEGQIPDDDGQTANLPGIVSVIAGEENISPAVLQDYLSAVYLTPYADMKGEMADSVWRMLKRTWNEESVGKQFRTSFQAFQAWAHSVEGHVPDFIDWLTSLGENREDQYPAIFAQLGVDTTKTPSGAWVRSIPIEAFPKWQEVADSWNKANADPDIIFA